MLQRLAVVASLVLLAAPAHAQLARSFSSATYTGVGASRLSADFDNLKDAYNLDAIGGYNITPAQPWGRIAAELNLSVTVSPGKNQGPGRSATPGGVLGGGSSGDSGRFTQSDNDLQTFILNVQGIYRTPGRVYGMATVGFGLLNTSIQEIEDNGRTAVSFGGGVGFKFGENTAAVELLFTRLSEDLQTIGLRFVY